MLYHAGTRTDSLASVSRNRLRIRRGLEEAVEADPSCSLGEQRRAQPVHCATRGDAEGQDTCTCTGLPFVYAAVEASLQPIARSRYAAALHRLQTRGVPAAHRDYAGGTPPSRAARATPFASFCRSASLSTPFSFSPARKAVRLAAACPATSANASSRNVCCKCPRPRS